MANDRFSIFKVISEALGGHKGWQPMWREPEPKPAYDVIIVGDKSIDCFGFSSKNSGTFFFCFMRRFWKLKRPCSAALWPSLEMNEGQGFESWYWVSS